MYIKVDYDFNDLKDNCWYGAQETLKVIEENGKEDAFMEFLEECYDDSTLTEVNDLLRFEDDYIYSVLGIKEKD